MKKIYAMAFLMLGVNCACFSEEVSQKPSAQLITQDTAPGTQGCQQLPADQNNFMMQMMKPENKSMFCNKFTPEQRKSAMQMMGTMGSGGSKMTADQAVEQVAKQAPTQTSQQPQPSSQKSGCPSRSQ